MSMLASVLFVLAQAAAPAGVDTSKVDPKVAAQVPVITEKLRQWRGTWAAVDGKLACRTVKTSGDEEVDKIGCFATLTCVKPAYPELKAIADGKGTEDDKKLRMRAKLDSLQTCMTRHRGQGIAELALKRGKGA
ncbi:hypothetical protein A6F68_00528 [Tsuneonella dongtanensis]|uniref:Uncharacterized protein n=1 Tax=Tsuneonella dongtanensis TaxID=692370 RepID=A0A1B2AA58_9SPHN|nr:hypothetical protein [Tsuneonella dongtanensis]ANY19063.1 hypothetical protein A6F68_00528 [Tsuneonella dongtanensis]